MSHGIYEASLTRIGPFVYGYACVMFMHTSPASQSLFRLLHRNIGYLGTSELQLSIGNM